MLHKKYFTKKNLF